MKSITVANTHASRKPTLGGRLRSWFYSLFRPEVVEVTFHKVGNQITYTYTKVPDKQVA